MIRYGMRRKPGLTPHAVAGISNATLYVTTDTTMPMITLPTYDDLMNPLLGALRKLGGSGSIEEIYALSRRTAQAALDKPCRVTRLHGNGLGARVASSHPVPQAVSMASA
jgi:hypothetical protein